MRLEGESKCICWEKRRDCNGGDSSRVECEQ
jgi:hypothetical protein